MKYLILMHRMMFVTILVITFFAGAVSRAHEMMVHNLTTNELLGMGIDELSRVKAL